MSKIIIWETLSKIGGGQEMTLKVADILSGENELHFLIPEKGELSEALENRKIPYTLMGDQSMPKGEKGVKGLLKFVFLTFKAFAKGRKIVKEQKPDFLYAPGPAALVWSAMCAKRSTKVIWHLHHFFQSGATKKLINLFSKRNCVKRIISVSDFVSQQIKEENAQSKKITIYNPIKPLSEDVVRKNLCDEYPALSSDLKIAHIGFITPMKKQDVSIEVMNLLCSKGVNATLAIIGSISVGDEWYKAELDEKIESYGLGDRVVFTGYRTDVREILSTFDVVVLPSVEGFPLVGLQAIMENVPLLCVDNSGSAELVEKTSCGMIYSSQSDVSVIAETLEKASAIDVKSQTKKHPEFIFSECSDENFERKIIDIFSL